MKTNSDSIHVEQVKSVSSSETIPWVRNIEPLMRQYRYAVLLKTGYESVANRAQNGDILTKDKPTMLIECVDSCYEQKVPTF